MRPSVFKLIDAMLKARAAFDGWITLTSRNGDGDKVGGSRVLLDDDGAIVYGLGGGHAGKKLGDALNDIKQTSKKTVATPKAASRFSGKTQMNENQPVPTQSNPVSKLRGEKRANAVAAYINEQGHNIDQFRSGSFKGYPQYYFPGAGAGGQKQAFIRAVGTEIAAKCDIQDNGGLGVVIVPKNVDRLDANRYAPQPQKATRARAIENMNEAQLNKEIASASSERVRLQNRLDTVREKIANSFGAQSQKDMPLGYGSGDKRNAALARKIEADNRQAIQNGKQLQDILERISQKDRQIANMQRALKDVQGTGQTQKDVYSQRQNVPQTMKWAKTQSAERVGTGYKPQVIKSGDYEIRGSSGVYRIYHQGKQFATASKLNEAKNYAESHSKRGKA